LTDSGIRVGNERCLFRSDVEGFVGNHCAGTTSVPSDSFVNYSEYWQLAIGTLTGIGTFLMRR
jgi:hypothetical protein